MAVRSISCLYIGIMLRPDRPVHFVNKSQKQEHQMKSRQYAPFFTAVALFALLSFPLAAEASHSWGNYHWARTTNSFTVRVVDSNTSDWDGALNTALRDWTGSNVLNMIWASGSDVQNTRK